jgi:hypothetical protein
VQKIPNYAKQCLADHSVYMRAGGYTKPILVVSHTLWYHILRQTIKKNPLFEANYHKINPLPRGPWPKVRGAKWSARTWNFRGHNKKNRNIFRSDGFLQNILRDFWSFQKSKTVHFLAQFTTSYTWIGSKSHMP